MSALAVSAPSAPAAVDSMYEALARWQWWRCRRDRGRGELVDLRKRLAAGDGTLVPADGGAGLDRWLQRHVGWRGGRVLDLGCGFGASLVRWVATDSAARGVGVTASDVQARHAAAQLAAHGVGARVDVLRQDFTAPVAGCFDVVLAIESLGHARDLVAVLRGVAAALARGGRFVWVDDGLRASAPADGDVAELAARWASPPLRDAAAARAALAAAGLGVVAEHDLTAQVPVRDAAALARAHRRLGLLRAVLPVPRLRRLADAFLGGLALERLYARGLACYRAWMCEADATPAVRR